MPMPRNRPDPLVNGPSEANGTPRARDHGQCPSCLKRFKPKSRVNRFCSTRCRLRAFWLEEIALAIGQGKADGLRRRWIMAGPDPNEIERWERLQLATFSTGGAR
jgi:endogenous inhibitor of DNA gyrase (YacG/DUF329 family)